LVVAKFPRPVRNAVFAPEFPEIEAVGVPPALLRNANLAELDAVAPTNRSRVELPGYREPRDEFQKLVPAPSAHDCHEGVAAPPLVRQRFADAAAERTSNESVSVHMIPPLDRVNALLVPPFAIAKTPVTSADARSTAEDVRTPEALE
jgi:hypothetical protein